MNRNDSIKINKNDNSQDLINLKSIRDPYGDDYSTFRKLPKKQREKIHRKHVRANSKKSYVFANKASSIFASIMRYALLICLGYLILNPIFKMISTAFTAPTELGSPTSIWIPAKLSKEHLYMAFRAMNYNATLPYTFFTVSIQVLLQLFSTMLAGYAFARVGFKGKRLLFILVILQIIVPAQAISLPQYLNFRNFDIFGLFKAITGQPLNLLNNPITLYILAITGQGLKSGIFIYIFRQGFINLPKELEDSAYVDGSGYLRTFFSIILPSAGSTLLTAAVLSFVWNWNDMYFVNMFASTPNNIMVKLNSATASMDQTLNSLVRNIDGATASQLELLVDSPLYKQAIADTMSLLTMIPVLVIYMVVQRWFIQSSTHAAVKG
ncbi:carbohydrate ABC transporter permease [Fastidiosipila sanguinis]|uniref:Carbohydrate ABC transporter permease n=1 Tax=Fastidiosipila sanguinis TaxID=236753 RepID=A0A2S0KNE1_9FIRM|nr:carbohydrate ABC transporter permease [Fastidiosipila sanguinis]AVM42555.1 carbohydrate ABC transporter permease [Fastidiosipila sanguinis]